MADRSVALTTIKGGINRQRTKGGALEDSLYDLVNCYVTKSKTVKIRPGTPRIANLFSATGAGRSFIAGQATGAGFTLYGWYDDPEDVLGVGPVGSVPLAASYRGFPINGIFYTTDVPGGVYVLFGRDANGDLPTSMDPSIFAIDGIVSAELTSNQAAWGADGYVFQPNPLDVEPPFVDAEAYIFSFDPESTDPESDEATGITQGLMAFEGALHVFAHEAVAVPTGFVLHIITHPTDPASHIASIDFAAPFMGFPYVVATFGNGDTYHFWLQSGDEWQPDTIYRAGDIVVPSVDTGLSYQASRLLPPNQSWAPNVVRSLGDVVEPTVYNDFFYTVVDTQGDNPRSGTTEPLWPTEDGARINEDADGTTTDPPSVTQPPDPNAVPSPGITDRYNNLFRRF